MRSLLAELENCGYRFHLVDGRVAVRPIPTDTERVLMRASVDRLMAELRDREDATRRMVDGPPAAIDEPAWPVLEAG